MQYVDENRERKRVSGPLLAGSALAAVALIPVAWWQGDPLITALPALVPFIVSLRQ